MFMRRLMITVDVEAQPRRAYEAHVDRLIWGKHPEGQAGITEMMDIADEFGVTMTMFLDWAETDIYGASIDEVGQNIHERGHDLQLHVHPNFFSKEFWKQRALQPVTDMNRSSVDQSRVIAKEIVDRQRRATGTSAVAFRGGAYRFSGSLLQALHENGVQVDSSLNTARREGATGHCAQFRWANGLIELPISIVSDYRKTGKPLEFNFNSGYFKDAGSMQAYLEAFWTEHGDDAIAVLVMHSWSFLTLRADGIFAYEGTHRVERFRQLLEGLNAAGAKVVSAREVIQLASSGDLRIDARDDLSTMVQDVSAIVPAPSCPICQAPKYMISKLGGRQCSECGSVERQRSFAVAYDRSIRAKCNVAGKDVLVLSASASETRFLKARGASTTSADIMPDRKADLVVDFCNMPQVATASRSVVFASYVMPLVYDLDKSIDEIARVLEDGGTFFSVETPIAGDTREVQDDESRAQWYGRDALEKYRVGTYRVLGRDSYLSKLEERFTVDMQVVADPITGKEAAIYVCRKVAL